MAKVENEHLQEWYDSGLQVRRPSTECNVPDGKSGDWEVDTFTITKEQASFQQLRCVFQGVGGRGVLPGTYKRLLYKNETVMSNTPAECNDHRLFVSHAKGCVLLNGLGLGIVLSEILAKEEVKEVTVIENSADVITLVAPTYATDDRVTIIYADAYVWKPPRGIRYDVVWHDIWNTICSDNFSEMTKLHRKYGRRCDWQGSWCRELCRRTS